MSVGFSGFLLTILLTV